MDENQKIYYPYIYNISLYLKLIISNFITGKKKLYIAHTR